jgi:hypothetical protein
MPEPLPGEIREIADRQHGVLTAGQLAQAGLTRNAVRSKVRLGRWQRLHRGVYATFSGEPGRLAVLWAAVLSAGPGAMLSHQTAAELAGLADQASEITHVTVPADRHVSRPAGVALHRSHQAREKLHPVRLPPQTRVEDTVLDLADTALTIDDACGWVFRGLQRRRTTRAKLAEALSARSRMRWRTELTELLTLDAAGLDSVLELRYHRDVERPHGLPRGARQRMYRRGNHNEYRDVLYEAYLTAVELDGSATHRRDTRRQDVARDNAAAEDGITTLRYGWLEVTASPCAVAAQVARVLERRGFTGARPCSAGCPVGRVPLERADSQPVPGRPPSPPPRLTGPSQRAGTGPSGRPGKSARFAASAGRITRSGQPGH